MTVIKSKWICPNGCISGHAAEVPCPEVVAASERSRRNWKPRSTPVLSGPAEGDKHHCSLCLPRATQPITLQPA